MAALKKELMHANQEVRRLRASVAGWQGEVQRLEATMKAQHELDIASLTRISDLLGGLIESELDDVGVEESSQDFEFDDAPVDAVLQEFETDNGDVDELMDVSEPDDVLVPEVTP